MVGNAGPGNSVSAGARVLQSRLQAWGYNSEIYAEAVAPASSWGTILPFARYKPGDSDLLIFHYTHASSLADYLKTLQVPLILVYHNVTPPEFFVGANAQVFLHAQRGQAELPAFREQTLLALADSEFNRRDLVEAGYTQTNVLPVIIPDTLQRVSPDADVLTQLENSVNLLCVGRVAPNKCLEDVIKTLFYYRQIESQAHLLLVGDTASARLYVHWLRDLINWLGLDGVVTFTGHVPETTLAAYYRQAAAFVYMSEHEGFGIPLVESMRFGVPIVAYASTAVPETLGGTGILVTQKRFAVVAELIHLLQADAELRQHIISRQLERARDFEPDRVLSRFRELLEQAIRQI